MNWATSMEVEYATGEAKEDQTFEEFMQEMHMLENPTVLDDELTDDFDRWLGELTKIDVTRYAVEWKGDEYPFIVSRDYCKEVGIE